ncbi:MAG: phage major capsid protein [Oscillospiraceae bacterium]|jgi:HK97 family phage major capsid protein|nr:phage major capsid protein [Oscillospiraceae bacterium]
MTKGYYIAERRGIAVQVFRDSNFATKGKVGIMGSERVGGALVDLAAVKALEVTTGE